jgi:hypothetical protein
MALPPVLVGAVQSTTREVAPPVAATAVGTAGVEVAAATIDADAADVSEVVPFPLGVTVKVYASPFVNPETVHVCAPVGGVVLFTTVQEDSTAPAAPDVEATV